MSGSVNLPEAAGEPETEAVAPTVPPTTEISKASEWFTPSIIVPAVLGLFALFVTVYLRRKQRRQSPIRELVENLLIFKKHNDTFHEQIDAAPSQQARILESQWGAVADAYESVNTSLAKSEAEWKEEVVNIVIPLHTRFKELKTKCSSVISEGQKKTALALMGEDTDLSLMENEVSKVIEEIVAELKKTYL